MPLGAVFEQLIGHDLDDLLAYKTAKTVVIRDRKVGLTSVLLNVAVLIYILVISMLFNKQYFAHDTISGETQV